VPVAGRLAARSLGPYDVFRDLHRSVGDRDETCGVSVAMIMMEGQPEQDQGDSPIQTECVP
jgi:hypothetical protein